MSDIRTMQIGQKGEFQESIPANLKALGWAADEARGSLESVYESTRSKAVQAIEWYLKAKVSRNRMARTVRGVAIGLTGLAGLLPMLAQLRSSESTSQIQPVWASISLGLAATLVMFDRFFGFSTSWLRFVSTELQLQQMLDTFQLDWEADRASRKESTPSDEQIQGALIKCRTFASQVNEVIRNETAAWVAEFQQSAKEIDELAKVGTAPGRPAAINVTLTNGDQVPRWSLQLDGGPLRDGTGKSGALSALPGLHIVRAHGVLGNKAMVDERAVEVASGAITDVTLTLA